MNTVNTAGGQQFIGEKSNLEEGQSKHLCDLLNDSLYEQHFQYYTVCGPTVI